MILRSHARAAAIIVKTMRRHGWRRSVDPLTRAPPVAPVFRRVLEDGTVQFFGAHALARRVLMHPRYLHDAEIARLGRVLQRHTLLQEARAPPVNAVDPITLEAPDEPVFRHTAAHGAVTCFDSTQLAQYLRASGRFVNPLNSAPFTLEEVQCLGELAGDLTLAQEMQAIAARNAAERDRAAVIQWMQQEVCASMQALLAEGEAPPAAAAEGGGGWGPRLTMTRIVQVHVRELYSRLEELETASRDAAQETMQHLHSSMIYQHLEQALHAPWVHELADIALQIWAQDAHIEDALLDFMRAANLMYMTLLLT